MSDTDGKKPLGLGGAPRSGQVKQSFSHGRTKSVVVETKRKRVVVPTKPGAAGATGAGGGSPNLGDPAKRPAGISDAEMERRLTALRAAKAREVADNERRAEDERQREEDRQRRREEIEAKEREERERLEALRLKAEEEERTVRAEADARVAAAAQRKADVLGTRPRSNEKPAEAKSGPATPAPADAPTNRNQDATGPRGVAAKAPLAPTPQRKTDREREERERSAKAKGDDNRRGGKLTLSAALNGEGGRTRSLAAMKRKQEKARQKALGFGNKPEKQVRDVQLPETIVVSELANRMAERAADVVKSLMKMGMMVTMNQAIDADTAELVIEEFGHKAVRVSDSDVEQVIDSVKDRDEDLQTRPPIVTIMGHVDHGKTSLLDAIRKANVVSGEAGGITQHIGAYQVRTPNGALVSFLDTPGHAAFTSMRARGASVTDIVVLVVAADDAVMPQTIEAIHHAKAAKVPLIVAINKMDKHGADATKVRTDLLQHEIVVEAMSGDVQDVELSAKTGMGIDTLLEAIALQAEILELKANPKRSASGAVIEAKLDVGRGPVATVLVQNGTLRKGDIFVVGEQWGKVRALINDQGETVLEAGPSVPVEVLGLSGTPSAGDTLNVVETEAQAREIADYREKAAKDKRAAAGAATTLEQLMAKAKADQSVAELPILVKADVQGSAEAIVQALEKVGNDEVRVRILHYGVGAITDTDVGLAEASGAPIIGFNVRANASARQSANQKGVEIRYYSIIYDLVDDIKAAASGLLKAEVRETFIGYAQIKEVFKVTGIGQVAGCLVTEGVARRSAGVRLLRDSVVIHEGTLKTLKRFKDEVKEVISGQECGMAFERYEDIRPGDVIEIFEREEVQRSLA
ncbi:MAG: translation initiation factor IF-2 [Pseudotabrizicola sp.]|uniref:translation initiation factor IF-2 n=2 Tax=Paracoccaceae TaxID=31989 RepID=UPI002721FD37|nr:translation initiation factor IF-2 [Pseudotabrizicola sp.]MDO8884156.1 translation initiation factor IF-2 [Pseudotabrizicola sp.]MDP2083342.1 translation initiation factor IF-2 [Pseudotabrizicola sp.]MDZ7574880.1 translation initiation factor IF-2 [Pseudotabrizicola sp.]